MSFLASKPKIQPIPKEADEETAAIRAEDAQRRARKGQNRASTILASGQESIGKQLTGG